MQVVGQTHLNLENNRFTFGIKENTLLRLYNGDEKKQNNMED